MKASTLARRNACGKNLPYPACRPAGVVHLLAKTTSPVLLTASGHKNTAEHPHMPTLQVALPLSLTQLGDRLRSGYYRQPAALACDIATIASNAAAFNGADSELADDAAALAAYLTLVLQGQVGRHALRGHAAGPHSVPLQ